MWTDERLNERFDGLDKRLDRVDADIRDLRTDIREVRTLMFQLWGSNMLAILVTIGTIIATNG